MKIYRDSFPIISKDIINCINAMKHFNMYDIISLGFITDPIVKSSITPVFLYDNKIFSHVAKNITIYTNANTNISEQLDTSSFDPLTISPSFIVFPNKPLMNSFILNKNTSDIATVITIQPSILSSMIKNQLINEIHITDNCEVEFMSSINIPQNNNFQLNLFNKNLSRFTVPEYIYINFNYNIEIIKMIVRLLNNSSPIENESVLIIDDKEKLKNIYEDFSNYKTYTDGVIKIFSDFIFQVPERIIARSIEIKNNFSSYPLQCTVLEVFYKQVVTIIHYTYFLYEYTM